jgi:putative transposase
MPFPPCRKKIRLSSYAYRQGHGFFLTLGTYDRYPWFQSHPDVVEAGTGQLRHMAEERQSLVYAWCFMPDHVHLLIQDVNVLDFVRLFKGRLATKASALQPHKRLWQRSFHDRALRKEEKLEDVARYIWENPVRAGMVHTAQEYLWSGSHVWSDWRDFYGRG